MRDCFVTAQRRFSGVFVPESGSHRMNQQTDRLLPPLLDGLPELDAQMGVVDRGIRVRPTKAHALPAFRHSPYASRSRKADQSDILRMCKSQFHLAAFDESGAKNGDLLCNLL